jgi:hypothetical protein
VHAHAVGDVNGLVGVVNSDVHVHAEDELLARHEPQRRDEVAVARPRHDPLVLPHGERVRAGRADRQALVPRGALRQPAQVAQLGPGLARVLARRGGDLADRLHQLRLHLALGRRHRLEHRLDRVRELERLRVDDHELLLDPEREARAGEPVLHRAAW